MFCLPFGSNKIILYLYANFNAARKKIKIKFQASLNFKSHSTIILNYFNFFKIVTFDVYWQRLIIRISGKYLEFEITYKQA